MSVAVLISAAVAVVTVESEERAITMTRLGNKAARISIITEADIARL